MANVQVVIDVGTNNEKLLNSKLYMGLRQRRLEGKPFVDLMDEFVSAITQRYPHAVLQFEDFAIDRAQPLLERYRYDHLVFNDDIQVQRPGLWCHGRSFQRPLRQTLQQQLLIVRVAGAMESCMCARWFTCTGHTWQDLNRQCQKMATAHECCC